MAESPDVRGTTRQELEARSCAYCDKRFKPKRTTHIYCSDLCKRRASKVARLIDSPELTDRRCSWCGDRISSSNPKAKFCSDGCRLSHFKAKPCIYCGQEAQSRDHFIPKSFAARVEDFATIKKRKLIVPCCSQCNSTAGDQVFLTLKEKRLYIHERYTIKYRKLLDSPYWTDEEIEELGHELSSHIRRDQAIKKHIRRRMARLKRGS